MLAQTEARFTYQTNTLHAEAKKREEKESTFSARLESWGQQQELNRENIY
jgi:hypothetical protein